MNILYMILRILITVITHVRHKRVALVIRDNINCFHIPRSRDQRMIESHLRVATNKIYIERLQEILDDILLHKSEKKAGENYG